MPTDHSTSDQDFHFKELLNLSGQTTSLSRDGERVSLPNNGLSTQSTRSSEATTGRTMPLKSNPMVEAATSDALQVSLEDGGKCSD
jgi:hypothetical protein